MKNYLLSATLLGTVAIVLQVQPSQALTSIEVAKIAKQSTVRIESDRSPGSGVIIQRNGNIYTVLTAAHVVRNRNNQFKIVTSNGTTEKISEIKVSDQDIDLAVVKFVSNNNYPVAKLVKDSGEAIEGSTVYVSGFPVTATINEAIYNFTEGKITANSARPLSDGYSIVYSNNTLPGHSGGPVWNDRGEIVAIHGKGDVEAKQTKSDINPNVRVKTGFNLGISMNTFVQIAAKIGVPGFSAAAPVVVATKPQADEFIVKGLEKVNQRNYKAAIADFDQAIQIAPQRAVAYLYRGNARTLEIEFRALQDNSVTTSVVNKITENSNQDFELVFYRQFAKDYQTALADFQRAYQLDPTSGEALAGSAGIYRNLGQYPQAIDLLTRSIALKPSAEAYGTIAIAKSKSGDYQGALADCARAERLAPRDHTYPSVCGRIHNDNKNYAQAVKYYNQAISLTPKNDRLNLSIYSFMKGLAKSEIPDIPGAIADVNKAIQLNDNPGLKGIFYLTRGGLHTKNENFRQAVQDFTLSLQSDPASHTTLYLRGVSYFSLKNYGPALADINQVIKLAPDFPDAYAMKGAIYASTDRRELAIPELSRAIDKARRNPQSSQAFPDALYLRGALYFAQGNKRAAIPDLEEAVKLYQAAKNTVRYQEVQAILKEIR